MGLNRRTFLKVTAGLLVPVVVGLRSDEEALRRFWALDKTMVSGDGRFPTVIRMGDFVYTDVVVDNAAVFSFFDPLVIDDERVSVIGITGNTLTVVRFTPNPLHVAAGLT